MKHTLTLLAALLLFTLSELHAADATRPPNVVYNMADDLGWGDISVHGGSMPTPNIDRIFQQGVEFTQFMGGCVCSPTRAMLLTGRNPFRVGTAPEVGGKLALDLVQWPGHSQRRFPSEQLVHRPTSSDRPSVGVRK